MEQVLHLFITNTCRHNCPLCCNKFYKIDEIPVVTVELLKSVDTVCLTGGEPLSIPFDILSRFISNIRCEYGNIHNLYIYTSGSEAGYNLLDLLETTSGIDGVNFAPKDFGDILGVKKAIDTCMKWFKNPHHSNRLYAFKNMRPVIDCMMQQYDKYAAPFRPQIAVIDRQWTKTFNTPENEHFARLPILF